MDDRICVWPNGIWCYYDELEELLVWNSDDYEVMSINTDEGQRVINGC